MHTAETGHSFYFENAKAIDHGRFREDHKQSIDVSLPLQYQAIQIRTNHKEVQQIHVRD